MTSATNALWSVDGSRCLLERGVCWLSSELRRNCIDLVMTRCLSRKSELGNRIRAQADLLEGISARIAELRGDGPIFPEMSTVADLRSAIPPGCAGLSDESFRTTAHRRLLDSDTCRLLDDLQRELFEPVSRTSGENEFFTSIVEHPWMLPRQPGRPPEIRLVEVSPDSRSRQALLHDAMFSIELCAAELCAATMALHLEEGPIGLLADLAKQVQDELRHFALLSSLLERAGGAVGDFPVDTLIWDKFLLGSNLVDRLMIEQRLGEGIGLDGGLALYREALSRGDSRSAVVFDFINADEMSHVRNGNRWLSVLCEGPAGVRAVEERILSVLSAHGWPVLYHPPINEADRLLAGFTVAEVDQMRAQALRGDSA